MKIYNTKIRRNILYQYISSIELDLRNDILNRKFTIEKYKQKAKDRFFSENQGIDEVSDDQLLIYLDY